MILPVTPTLILQRMRRFSRVFTSERQISILASRCQIPRRKNNMSLLLKMSELPLTGEVNLLTPHEYIGMGKFRRV